MYWVKTPWFVKKIFKNFTWNKSPAEKKIFLTFDDGPIPEVTEWVLKTLEKQKAKATFFCVGENVVKNNAIYQNVKQAGHCIGNHTFNHLNGWDSDDEVYFSSVQKTQEVLGNNSKDIKKIFRPPYGKITPSQSVALRNEGYEIIMWDILSADFDANISAKTCLKNVKKNTESGSIVVFHDNIKSFDKLQYVLPRYLKYLKRKGFETAVIC